MTSENATPWAATPARRRRLANGVLLLLLFVAACRGTAPVHLDAEQSDELWTCHASAEGGWDCVRNAADARAEELAAVERGEQPR